MVRRLAGLLILARVVVCAGQGPEGLRNGTFEAMTPVTPGPEGLVSGWDLGDPPEVPSPWTLNSAYPGELTRGRGPGHGGERYVRLSASGRTSAHLYQPCAGLLPGSWYRVSAWVRGGPLSLHFYEYFQDGHIGGAAAAQDAVGGAAWRLVTGFYRTPTSATDR